MQSLPNYLYIAASVFFIYGLKMLGKANTARKGNMISAIGMLIAVVATLISAELNIKWIVVGAVVGAVIGAASARLVKMTSMPEMVGLFNGFGGLASLLVGWAEYHRIAGGGRKQPVYSGCHRTYRLDWRRHLLRQHDCLRQAR